MSDYTLRLLTSPDTDVEVLLGLDDLVSSLEDYGRYSVLSYVRGSNPSSGANTAKTAVEAIGRFVPKLLNVALREIPSETAKENPHLAVTYPKNATAMLALYCRESRGINEVIPIIFSTLSRRGVLHPAIAQNMYQVVSSAFSDPLKENFAAERVKLALNEEVMHGAIRQLSHSTTIADMLLLVFAPGNTVQTVEKPMSLARNTFAEHCVQLGFPSVLVNYAPAALANEECGPYFYFLSELLSKCCTAEAGPFVDELMTEKTCGVLFDAIADAVCVMDPNAFPLAGEGLRIIHGTLTVLSVVHGVDGLETDALSKAPWPVPLTKTFEVLPRMIERAIQPDPEGVSPLAVPNGRKVLGETRYRLARLLTVLVQMPFAGVLERLLAPGGLVDTVLLFCEQYPESDLLSTTLDGFFQRLSIWKNISTPAGAAGGSDDVSQRLQALAARVLRWGEVPSIKGSPLGSHLAYYLQRLDMLHGLDLIPQTWEMMPKLMELVVDNTLVRGYETKISGEHFEEKVEDKELEPVRHRELCNPRHVSLDVASPLTPLSNLDEKIAKPTPPPKQEDSQERARARYASLQIDDEPDRDGAQGGQDPEVEDLVMKEDKDWLWVESGERPGSGGDGSGGKSNNSTGAGTSQQHSAAQEDDEAVWETANAQFHEVVGQPAFPAASDHPPHDHSGAVEEVRGVSDGDDGEQIERPGSGGPDITSSPDLRSHRLPASDLRPASNESAEGFYASGVVPRGDGEEDVVCFTPPATPPDQHSMQMHQLEALWRPGSRGDGDGALPMSAGSLSGRSVDDEVIPHPPNGVEAEDDEEEESEDEEDAHT